MEVGKTSLLKWLIDDQFTVETNPTIGVNYMTTVIEIDTHTVKLQIWDTTGHEKFQ
jgi:small GTP-binding protein